MSPTKDKQGFSAEEKAAMRARAKELKAAAEGEEAVQAALAKMAPDDRALGERTKLTQTMRFDTTEQRDTTMQYGVEEGAKSGFARVDALLRRLQGATR